MLWALITPLCRLPSSETPDTSVLSVSQEAPTGVGDQSGAPQETPTGAGGQSGVPQEAPIGAEGQSEAPLSSSSADAPLSPRCSPPPPPSPPALPSPVVGRCL